MKPEIKRIHSPDVDDVVNYRPETSDNFGFLLQIMVGVKGKEGEESFDTFICTPKWLMSNCKNSDILNGIYHLIVFEYDYYNILNFLKNNIEIHESSNWYELAEKIKLLGRWEFENYTT